MTANVVIKVNNVAACQRALSDSGLMSAAMSGGRVIQSNARIYAPKDTNNLAESIIAAPQEQAQTRAWVQIGTSVIYAQIQELGGTIKPKTAKLLSWISESGERVFARAVVIKAQPYLRPAMDKHKGEARSAIGAAVVSILNKVAK